MDKPKLILIGGGGHCRSCIDVIEAEGHFEISGIVERPDCAGTGAVLGYPILGTDDDLSDLKKNYGYAFVTVGHIESVKPRIKLYEVLKSLGYSVPTIVAPTAYISRYAEIGEGCIIMHQALVNAGARVGANCIINTKALVEHDAIIGAHSHIATGAIVNGGATVGCASFLGSSSVTIELTKIAPNSFAKANSLVLR